jgi:hypothetical protein
LLLTFQIGNFDNEAFPLLPVTMTIPAPPDKAGQ